MKSAEQSRVRNNGTEGEARASETVELLYALTVNNMIFKRPSIKATFEEIKYLSDSSAVGGFCGYLPVVCF
jgi:hypothetical protein